MIYFGYRSSIRCHGSPCKLGVFLSPAPRLSATRKWNMDIYQDVVHSLLGQKKEHGIRINR